MHIDFISTILPVPHLIYMYIYVCTYVCMGSYAIIIIMCIFANGSIQKALVN